MILCHTGLHTSVGGGVPSAPLVGLRAPRTPQVGGGVPSAPYGLAV